LKVQLQLHLPALVLARLGVRAVLRQHLRVWWRVNIVLASIEGEREGGGNGGDQTDRGGEKEEGKLHSGSGVEVEGFAASWRWGRKAGYYVQRGMLGDVNRVLDVVAEDAAECSGAEESGLAASL